MKATLAIFSILLFFTPDVVAQRGKKNPYPFSDEPVTFITDVTNAIRAKKKPEFTDIAESFEVYWRYDSLTPSTKTHFMEIAKIIHDKNLPIIPYYTSNMQLIRYLNDVTDAVDADYDTIFITTKKVLQNHNTKDINRYYEILLTFFKEDALYKTNNSSFFNSAGLLKIRYVDSFEEEYEIQETTTQSEEDAWGSFDSWDAPADKVDESWGTFDEKDPWATPEPIEETPSENFEEALLAMPSTDPPPPISGPVIEFTNADFNIVTRFDTVVIRNTNASLLLTKGTLVGNGGKMDFTSAGLDSSVQVEFKNYHFDITKPNFKAEDVKLSYPEKLEEPIEGLFEYSSRAHKTPLDATFPRFMSYKSNIQIKDLGEDIKYYGGFSLNGHKVYSSSVTGGNCLLEVYNEGQKKFRSRAKFFIMEDSMITARPTNISVYFAQDSIYHPGTSFSYDRLNKKLTLHKDKGGFKNAFFEDTYHHINILIDALYWNLSDSVIDMTMLYAKSVAPAFIESWDNYQFKKYAQLKGIYNFHALQMAVNYSEKNGNIRSFFVDDFKNFYPKVDVNQIKSAMLGLMLYGYVDYNPVGGHVKLKDKAFHYVGSRKLANDYDNIAFKSVNPSKYNATINLNNNQLKITGVDEIPVSDSLKVSFFQRNREVIITEDRNMIFDGIVQTNSYIFNGRDFKFNYENFDIDLKNIDSIKFEVDVVDSTTGKTTGKKQLNNQLKYTSGLLTIDEANNKSTRVRNPKYPHFGAVAGAYVYFSGKEVLNGIYDSTIYYKIPPFDMDSLSDDISALGFNGTFHSPIFPPFEQQLKVMPDHSFGFVHNVPETGYPLYSGQGVFYGDIKMDAGGLRGDGRIEFLNSTLYSNDFVFYKDSVKTVGTKYITKPGSNPKLDPSIKFPAQTVSVYELNWQVSKDSMNITNLQKPFTTFKDSLDFIGTISLTTNRGMLGNGFLKTPESKTISPNIQFREYGLESENSQFQILSGNNTVPAVKSDFVKLKLDLVERKAWFEPQEEGFASNSFPLLKYKTSIRKGFWDMDGRIVTFTKPAETDIKKSYFYSTHPKQDSLAFYGEKAIYIIDSTLLDVEGVPFIRAVDAEIIPNKNQLFIRPNAEIDTLYNCTVTMDTIHAYHVFHDSKIKIVSKRRFDGHGFYQYVNLSDDTLQMEFEKFFVQNFATKEGTKEYHSVTRANIFEDDTIRISDHILYKGPVEIRAHQKNMIMDGYVKLDLKGKVNSDVWMKNLASASAEHEVVIDLEHQDDTLFNGLILKSSGYALSSEFLAKTPKSEDQILFKAGGVLFFNEESNEFEVSTLKHLHQESLSENIFAYHEESEQFRYEGRFNLMKDLPKKEVTLDFAGTGYNQIDSNAFEIEGISKLFFTMPEKAYELMAKNISDYALATGQLGSSVAVNDTFYHEVAYLAGDKAGKQFNLMGGHVALSRVDKFFQQGIVFSHLRLHWDPETRSWFSVGKIGISNIGKKEVNTDLTGYFELKKTKNGDKINLYLEVIPSIWYYFSFEDNALIVLTSNYEVMNAIDEKSQMEKLQHTEKYYFGTGSAILKDKFLEAFETTHGTKTGESRVRNIPEAPKQEELYEYEDSYEYDELSEEGQTDDGETPKEETPVNNVTPENTPTEETIVPIDGDKSEENLDATEEEVVPLEEENVVPLEEEVIPIDETPESDSN